MAVAGKFLRGACSDHHDAPASWSHGREICGLSQCLSGVALPLHQSAKCMCEKKIAAVQSTQTGPI